MKNAALLDGILPAIATPMTDSGEVDLPTLAELTRRQIRAGVGGIVACGSTGEVSTLSMAEREQVLTAIVEAADGKVPVVAHAAALTTRDAVDLSIHAERAGATAIMVLPPFYEPLRWSEVIAHFQAIDDAVGVPLMLYNLPMATGVELTPSQVAELSGAAPGIRYVKDSTGRAGSLSSLLERSDSPVQVLNGWDTLTFFSFAAGARACVWGAATFMPELAVALHRALVVDCDLVEGRRLWHRIYPVCALLESGGYVPGVKAACELLGFPIGPPRLPFRPLDGDSLRMLESTLVAAGLLGRERA